MKKLSLLVIAFLASVSFADKKEIKNTAKTLTPAITKLDVTGGLKWTGFGVGKSHHGSIDLKSGYVEMKGSEVIGGNFILDMNTLKTGDSPKLEGHLKSADFFNVEKFSEGNFKITKVEALKSPAAGAPTHKITGDLTIKGKTHSEELLTTIAKQGTKYIAIGDTEIKDRTQYDIAYNSAKFKTVSALGDKLIQDNIKIELNLETK